MGPLSSRLYESPLELLYTTRPGAGARIVQAATCFLHLSTSSLDSIASSSALPRLARACAIIDRAHKAGLKRIVILEHVPEMPRYTRRVARGEVHDVPRPQIDAIRDEIQAWKRDSPVVLLLGAEVDANPTHRDGRLLLADLTDIDVVVASTLMSMGIMMLPPIMISFPLKIMLFVLVDGWDLLVEKLIMSFL